MTRPIDRTGRDCRAATEQWLKEQRARAKELAEKARLAARLVAITGMSDIEAIYEVNKESK